MGMAHPSDNWTAEMVRALPDDRNRYVGHAKIAPQDIEFDQRNMVQPDLFVLPLVNGAKPLEWDDVRRLLLAVEVLSPAMARHDRFSRRRLYQAQGVPEYWIVDVNTRMLEC
jgi:Uma2 family endonuclease